MAVNERLWEIEDDIRACEQKQNFDQEFIRLARSVYVENYDMNWGRLFTSGVDLWLNNPMRPQEASGTSGMKAAMNGVPSFSVVDGWWIEGHIEGQ